MNKKIKVIELINKIYANLDVPEKVKYKDREYFYKEYIQDYRRLANNSSIYLFDEIVNEGDRWLEVEVEILEDEEEIDIQGIEDLGISSNNIAEKISELIRAVKQLDKKINIIGKF